MNGQTEKDERDAQNELNRQLARRLERLVVDPFPGGGIRCERCEDLISPEQPVHDVAISVQALPANPDDLDFDPQIESLLCERCGDMLSRFMDGAELAR